MYLRLREHRGNIKTRVPLDQSVNFSQKTNLYSSTKVAIILDPTGLFYYNIYIYAHFEK